MIAIVGVLACTGALAACSSSGNKASEPANTGDGNSAPAGSTNSAPAANGSSSTSRKLTKVKIALVSVINTTPFFLGRDKGFYQDEGIDLQITPISGGAAGIPALINGQFQFMGAAYINIISAVSKNLPIKVVVNSTAAEPSGPHATDGIVTFDKNIKTPKDLTGKTVAANATAGVVPLTTLALVDKDGGDSNKVKILAVPFPDQVSALTSHRVDAISTEEPFLTEALEKGAHLVGRQYSDLESGFNTSAYITSDKVLEQDPDLVKRFISATKKAQDFATANPDAMRKAVGDYTKISKDVLAKIHLPNWNTSVNMASLKLQEELMVKYGYIKQSEVPSVDKMLAPQVPRIGG